MQLSEWMTYFALEPWGEERADFRAGTIASTIANVHRAEHTAAYQAADFMPYLKRDQAEHISEAELERRIDMFMTSYRTVH